MAIRQRSTDVLIIGGGMAGLCAAVRALQQGVKVLLIEKGTRFGGSMALSNGTIWSFVDAAVLKQHVPEGNPTLQEMLVEQLPNAFEWLTELGVQLEPEFAFLNYGRARRTEPAQMTAMLLHKIALLGGEAIHEVAMQELKMRDGEVTGVLAFDSKGPLEINASSVIIATGGFQGNPDLIARYITPTPDLLYLRSNPWSTGDGLLAASAVGAAITPLLNAFYGHAMSAPPARFNRLEFQAMSHKYGQMAVALNMAGERFADESSGTGEELLNSCIARQSGCKAVYVFDATVGERAIEGSPLPSVVIDRAKKAGACVIQASSLEELTQKMVAWDLPSNTALRTLLAYNEAIALGKHAELNPTRNGNHYPVVDSPFTAVLVQASITFTCGGIFTDMDMRVLRRSSSISSLALVTADVSELQTQPIANLFAAGSDVGGFSGHGYVGGLSQALVTGLRAGEEAAKSVKSLGAKTFNI
jgi:succinate dehydrogenase/fumarate reductase flavoprotein subunit